MPEQTETLGLGPDLDQFVERTLLDVVNGVASAQLQKPLGESVELPRDSRLHTVGVEFDIAVTARAESGGSGLKVKVLNWFDLTKSGGASASAEAVTRVKFSIMVVLPSRRD